MTPFPRKPLANLTSQLIRTISITQTASISTTARRYVNLPENKLTTVGPWPRTKEERILAARKYNLIPEDYEPYEEGLAQGDYPNLKPIGSYNRDRYGDFDDLSTMRYYGEVLHLDHELYEWERIDPLESEKPFLSTFQSFLFGFIFLIAIPYLSYKLATDTRINLNHNHKKRRHLPPDTKYYKFPNSGNEPIIH